MTEPTAAIMRAAWGAACAARDVAIAAPLIDLHYVKNLWVVLAAGIDDAATAGEKITAAERAERLMLHMSTGCRVRTPAGPPVDFHIAPDRPQRPRLWVERLHDNALFRS